ncbi:MAG: DUF1543 domain-containing protein [Flavobacterium sp.]|nr:DUF1543 domain-containing protein [Flavobacterium sp.]
MMNMKLYMLMVGCTPAGRFTEQHDIFFGIAENLATLIPQIKQFWPEAKGEIHIDAWREVTRVDGFQIEIFDRMNAQTTAETLYFINLGGYKPGDFEEYHYKLLSVAESLSDAIKAAKKTTFYKHYTFKGATSHIDDKYGIDVDDSYKVEEMLSEDLRTRYSIKLTRTDDNEEDQLHIGYLTLRKMSLINQ